MGKDELQAALDREANLRERLLVFGRIREALGRLRSLGSVKAMIDRAPAETARACDVDRVAVYRDRGRPAGRRGLPCAR